MVAPAKEAVRKSVNADKISCSKAVRASRRTLRALLSMRSVIDGINELSSS
jgi:hypothetical protein